MNGELCEMKFFDNRIVFKFDSGVSHIIKKVDEGYQRITTSPLKMKINSTATRDSFWVVIADVLPSELIETFRSGKYDNQLTKMKVL